MLVLWHYLPITIATSGKIGVLEMKYPLTLYKIHKGVGENIVWAGAGFAAVVLAWLLILINDRIYDITFAKVEKREQENHLALGEI